MLVVFIVLAVLTGSLVFCVALGTALRVLDDAEQWAYRPETAAGPTAQIIPFPSR